ncbi:hypothetical protein QJS66_17335 [Kocuria rhizophila]|nr:hypothetical protein QJS66_17335 [Kocuria rhizophila]
MDGWCEVAAASSPRSPTADAGSARGGPAAGHVPRGHQRHRVDPGLLSDHRAARRPLGVDAC